MTTISGICRDAAGDPVAGRVVRAYRLDTGSLIAATVSGDGSTSAPSTLLWGTTSTDLNPLADITISGGGVVASESTSSVAYIRTAAGKSSGKWYFEVEVTTESTTNLDAFIGLLTKAEVFSNLLSHGKTIRSNGTGYGVTGGASFTYGDRIQIAFDMDNLKAWFRKNGGSWFNGGDPVAGTSPSATLSAGEWCPMVSSDNNAGNHIFTGCFTAATFDNTAPSGFLPVGGEGQVLGIGEYMIDCGSYTNDVVVYQFDPADLTIRPQIHLSTPV